jgi:hypothetical protein
VEADVAELAVVGRLYNVNNPKEIGDYIVNGTGISIGAELGHPLTIYDPQTGIRCGVVYDDLELSTVGVSWPMLCSFVKLSQTTIGGTADDEDPMAYLGEDWSELSPGPSKGALGRPDENNKRNADTVRNFFNYDEYDCTRKWCVYNVLMVTWRDNVAFRIGVGKMHVDAFDTSKSLKTRKIYLG